MKKYLFFLFSFITSLLVISCQDEDFGYTEEEIFRNAYEKNFVKTFGPIDPNMSWDFSSYGKSLRSVKTRAGSADPIQTLVPVDADGYYTLPQNTVKEINSLLAEDDEHSGTSFGMIVGQDHFEIIPVYQNGAAEVDWTLHMVLVTQNSTEDIALFEKSQKVGDASNHGIRIKDSECDVCSGTGMKPGVTTGNDKCKQCINGYLPAIGSDCEKCGGDGVLEDYVSPCSNHCNNGQIDCTTCGGAGYVKVTRQETGWFGSTNNVTYYVSCKKYHDDNNGICDTDCGGKGETRSPWLSALGGLIGINKYEKGSGKIDCNVCGGDNKSNKDCDRCNHTGKAKPCTFCDHDGKGTYCENCGGTGTADDAEFHDIEKNDNTKNAIAIQSTPWIVSESSFNNTAEGNIVYFYLQIKDGAKRSSMDEKMVLLNINKPSNITTDCEYKVIGCDEDSDKDFNDFVFILLAKKLPQIFEYEENRPIETKVDKRFMIEDLGATNDWDFNDIVVDVYHTISKTINSNLEGYTETSTTYSIIKNLCGTLPIQVTVGTNGTYPKITNPMNQEQTYKQLDNESVQAKVFDAKKDKIEAWNPGARINNITGWNPKTNNITISVWKSDGSTKFGEDVWHSEFPKPGSVPYIIATDINIPITQEGDHVNTSSWWQENVANYYTGY